MIIFYNKKTGQIYGTVEGRVHLEHILDNVIIKPTNINSEEVGKYTVPFKPQIEEVEESIKEMRVVNEKTKRVEEVIVGKKKVQNTVGLIPNVPFADLIFDFEKGKDKIHNYKVKVDKQGNFKDLIKRRKR